MKPPTSLRWPPAKPFTSRAGRPSASGQHDHRAREIFAVAFEIAEHEGLDRRGRSIAERRGRVGVAALRAERGLEAQGTLEVAVSRRPTSSSARIRDLADRGPGPGGSGGRGADHRDRARAEAVARCRRVRPRRAAALAGPDRVSQAFACLARDVETAIGIALEALERAFDALDVSSAEEDLGVERLAQDAVHADRVRRSAVAGRSRSVRFRRSPGAAPRARPPRSTSWRPSKASKASPRQ